LGLNIITTNLGSYTRRIREEEDSTYSRSELPGRYMAKLLYRWNNGRFEREYLEKLERSWKK